MNITKSEIAKLTQYYVAALKVAGTGHSEAFRTAVQHFGSAYITAVHTTHSPDRVVGFINPDDDEKIRELFRDAWAQFQPSSSWPGQIIQIGKAIAAAIEDDISSPPHYGVTSGADLTRFDINNWKMQEVAPGLVQEGDVCFHFASGVSLSNLHLVAKHPNSKAALMHFAGRGLVANGTFANCIFEGLNWGGRSYRIQHLAFLSCEFRDIPREHGNYYNLAGDESDQETPATLYEDCLVENCAAQADQSTGAIGKRRLETPYPDDDNVPGGPLVKRRYMMRDVSNDEDNAVGGGTSYPLSYFEAKHHVLHEDVCLDNSMLPEAHGYMHVQGHSLDGFKRKVLDEGGYIILPKIKRPVGQFRSVHQVHFRDKDFNVAGGQNWIDCDNCDDVLFEGCTGNTLIRINGHPVGTVGEGFQS